MVQIKHRSCVANIANKLKVDAMIVDVRKNWRSIFLKLRVATRESNIQVINRYDITHRDY